MKDLCSQADQKTWGTVGQKRPNCIKYFYVVSKCRHCSIHQAMGLFLKLRILLSLKVPILKSCDFPFPAKLGKHFSSMKI
jgi:hypothetical protein